jgi:MFS family permease
MPTLQNPSPELGKGTPSGSPSSTVPLTRTPDTAEVSPIPTRAEDSASPTMKPTTPIAPPAVVEEEEDEEDQPQPGIVHSTPVPWKTLSALLMVQLNEAISISMLFPFVGFLVARVEGETDVSAAGYRAGFLIAMFQLAQFFSCRRWGRFSDHFGRRVTLQLGLLLGAVAVVGFGFTFSLWWAMLFRFFHGLANGNVAVAKTVIADITDETNRAVGYAAISASYGIGSFIGPAIGGVLYDPTKNPHLDFLQLAPDGIFAEFPALLPCLATACYSIAALVLSIFVLPETNPHAVHRISILDFLLSGCRLPEVRPQEPAEEDVEAANNGEASMPMKEAPEVAEPTNVAGSAPQEPPLTNELTVNPTSDPKAILNRRPPSQPLQPRARRDSSVDSAVGTGGSGGKTPRSPWSGPRTAPSPLASASSPLHLNDPLHRFIIGHSTGEVSALGRRTSYEELSTPRLSPKLRSKRKSVATGVGPDSPSGEASFSGRASSAFLVGEVDQSGARQPSTNSPISEVRSSSDSDPLDTKTLAPAVVSVPLRPPSGRRGLLTKTQSKFGWAEVYSRPRSRYTVILYMIISAVDFGYSETFPLWAMTSAARGGMGWSAESIGWFNVLQGVFNVAVNLAFPSVCRRFPNRYKFWRVALLVQLIGTVFVPWCNPQVFPNPNVGLFLLSIASILRIMGSFGSFGLIYLFVAEAAPKDVLGEMAGIAQASVSIIRCGFPLIAAPLFAASVLHAHPPWFDTRTIFTVFGWLLVYGMVASRWSESVAEQEAETAARSAQAEVVIIE